MPYLHTCVYMSTKQNEDQVKCATILFQWKLISIQKY